MEAIKDFFSKRDGVKKVAIVVIAVVIFYIMRNMMNLLLLTFIITYLTNRFHTFLTHNLERLGKIDGRLVTVLIYVAILVLLGTGIYSFAPKVIEQGHDLMVYIKFMTESPDKNALAKTGFGKEISVLLGNLPVNVDIYSYAQGFASGLIKFITNVGRWGLNIVAALVLSFFFMIDKGKIMNFVRKFKSSKIKFVYESGSIYYKIFLNSFGKVLEAQILIALVNTVLTTAGLIVMGFPGIFFLSVMVFILSMVPVAGVIVSFVPLSLIALRIGGFIKVIYVLALILSIHGIENYFLNPKLMSYKTKLPVFITLLILFLSEYLMGPWGLIFGLPIFMFVLELIKDNTEEISDKAVI